MEQPGQEPLPDGGPLPLELLLPPLIVLDAAPAYSPDTTWRRVMEVPGSLPSVHRTAQWRQLASDSLEIGWSNGFSGWVLRVRIAGDSLRGEAEEIYDAGDGSVVPARATRVPCDAPIPMEHRRRYGRAPYVELEDGTVLEVEQPFGSLASSFEPLGQRQYWTRLSSAGVFGGSDSVFVYVDNRGLISSIRVVYRGTSAAGRISQHLWALYGAPTWQDHRSDDDEDHKHPRNATWHDREIQAELRMHPDREGMVLRLADPKDE